MSYSYLGIRNKFLCLSKHKQGELYKSLTGRVYKAHDALEDCLALKELVKGYGNFDNTELAKYSHTSRFLQHRYEWTNNVQQNQLIKH